MTEGAAIHDRVRFNGQPGAPRDVPAPRHAIVA